MFKSIPINKKVVTIPRFTKLKHKVLTLPPSKAQAIRALFIPFLGIRRVTLKNIPDSDDFKVNLNAIKTLGIEVAKQRTGKYTNRLLLTTNNKPTNLQVPKSIYIGNSGLGARFLLTLLSLSKLTAKIMLGSQLAKRPILKDTEHLQRLGAQFKQSKNILYIDSTNIKPESTIFVKTATTSQYLSAILFFGWRVGIKKIKLQSKLISFSYVKTTLALLKQIGIYWSFSNQTYIFTLKSVNIKQKTNIQLPPDASIASNFLVLSSILKDRITIKNFKLSKNDPDYRIIEILQKVGAKYKFKGNNLIFYPDIKREYITIDLANNPDLLPPLTILLLFLKKGGILKNISHTQFKESARNHVLIQELSRLGFKIRQQNNNLKIDGQQSRITNLPINYQFPTLNPHNDHRIFMAFTILGACMGSIKHDRRRSVLSTRFYRIKNSHCLNKSFPDFLGYIF